MKAIYYEAFGDPQVLQYGERPIPKPAPGEVLVKVAACGVNPIDRRLRNGELQTYFTREFPIIPGWDFSGRIEKLGNDVREFSIGTDVLGLAFTWFLHAGTYAEYVCVDATSIAVKPPSISFAQAAALPLVSLTAWQALREFANLGSGQSVLIQAGAGGVGSVAIPIAKYLGATVYTTASGGNLDYVRSLGADYPIDYTTNDYVDVIRQSEPHGIDVVLESLAGEAAVNDAIKLVKSGGAVAYMNNDPPITTEIAERAIKAEFLHHRPDGAMLAMLADLFAKRTLPIPKIETMPLTAAADAHRKSESRRTQGKIVLHVQDV